MTSDSGVAVSELSIVNRCQPVLCIIIIISFCGSLHYYEFDGDVCGVILVLVKCRRGCRGRTKGTGQRYTARSDFSAFPCCCDSIRDQCSLLSSPVGPISGPAFGLTNTFLRHVAKDRQIEH